jgi:hypothetical protein
VVAPRSASANRTPIPTPTSRASERSICAWLNAEPLLQRLPYRDREIGVALAGLTGSDKPLLLVTYTGATAAARADVRAVLARLGDLGAEYAWRFRRLTAG